MNPDDKKFHSSRFSSTGVPAPRTDVEVPAFIRKAQAGGRTPMLPGPQLDPKNVNIPAYMRRKPKPPTATPPNTDQDVVEGLVSGSHLKDMMNYTNTIGQYLTDPAGRKALDELKKLLKWYLQQSNDQQGVVEGITDKYRFEKPNNHGGTFMFDKRTGNHLGILFTTHMGRDASGYPTWEHSAHSTAGPSGFMKQGGFKNESEAINWILKTHYLPPETVDESGLQAYLGKKKYGDEGMKALQKAGREGVSKEKMALIRAKYDKLDEQEVAEARLLSQHENGNRAVKIYRDTVWNEYIVRFYLNDEYEEKADYHTDDKQDAVDTARHWLKSGNPAAGTNISESLKTRVVRNLVRIEDILEGQQVYGGIDQNDQRLVRAAIKESMRGGIAFEDAILSMIQGFKEELDEYAPSGTTGTAASGNPAAPGAKSATASAPGTQANAAPASTGTVQAKPVSSQGVEALGQVLKNAGLTPSQLSTVTSLARKD